MCEHPPERVLDGGGVERQDQDDQSGEPQVPAESLEGDCFETSEGDLV